MRSVRTKVDGFLVVVFLLIAGATTGISVAAGPGTKATAAVESAASGPAVEITYLANEGFLIEIDAKKILIDALFDGETIKWCHVNSPDTLAKMERAEAPFNGIDLILTTHNHPDHFSAGPVMKLLAADPGPVFVGPPQAVRELEQALSRREEEQPGAEKPGEGRIKEIDLEMFESSTLDFDGIRVEAHRIHHSQFIDKDEKTGEETNRHQDVENIAYLIEIAGLRLLHVGDAVLPLNREYLESERFPHGTIDIVFLEYFDYSGETKDILAPLQPDHIVFMHLPPQPETIEKLSKYLWFNFPNAVLFQKPLEKRSF